MDFIPAIVKAKELLTELRLPDTIQVGLVAEYNFRKRIVILPQRILYGVDIRSCAVAFHEIGHAWQMEHMPGLFRFHRYYLPLLFLEWHASAKALQWLSSYYNDAQLVPIKAYYRKGLRSYAMPWKAMERLY